MAFIWQLFTEPGNLWMIPKDSLKWQHTKDPEHGSYWWVGLVRLGGSKARQAVQGHNRRVLCIQGKEAYGCMRCPGLGNGLSTTCLHDDVLCTRQA